MMTAQSFSAQPGPNQRGPGQKSPDQSYSLAGDSPANASVFKPTPPGSRWQGLAAVILSALIELALLGWLLRRPIDSWSFLFLLLVLLILPVLLHLAHRTWRLFSLEYWVDRNAIRIRCGAETVVIPLDTIEQIVGEASVSLNSSLRYWPGPFIRPLPSQGDGSAEMFATAPSEDSLWLLTEQADYMLSPADRDGFLAALQAHCNLGPSHPLVPGRERVADGLGLLLADRLSRGLLVAGLVGALLLVGLLFVAYPGLPERLIFHYDASGAPDSIRSKSALLLLPGIGVTAYLFNGVAGLWLMLRRQPTGAYLLWGSTLGVQLLSLLALFSLIR